MKKLHLLGAGAMVFASLALQSCNDEIIDQSSKEDYVKAFIERFGLPAEGHTFNDAKVATVTVKSRAERQVQVIANVDGKDYLFADWTVKGSEVIDFDVPSKVTDIKLYVDGQYYDTKVGATVDLDNLVLSRDGETLWDPTTTGTQIVLPISEVDQYGFVKADFSGVAAHGTDGRNGSTSLGESTITNCELDQYLSTNASFYEDIADFKPQYNGKDYPHFYISILNFNKPNPTHKYEVGYIYGVGSDDLRTATSLVYIPCYRTDDYNTADNVTASSSTAYKNPIFESQYPVSPSNFKDAGFKVTIDFSTVDVSSLSDDDKYVEANYGTIFSERYYELRNGNSKFRAITLDNIATFGNNSLEYSLQQLAASQTGTSPTVPTPAQVAATGGEINGVEIPQYDLNGGVNPWTFWGQWDAYMDEWYKANPTPGASAADRSKYHVFLDIMAYWYTVAPANAMPIVTKLGDHKYELTYWTAYGASSMGYIDYYTGNANQYQSWLDLEHFNDHRMYNYPSFYVNIPYDAQSPHPFTMYIKDLTDNTMITSANATHFKSMRKYVETSNGIKASDGWSIGMADINGDGVYSDFVFRHSIPSQPSDPAKTQPYTWYIACEDLGGTGDWDFNDAVVTVHYVSTNSMTERDVEIKAYAAGGIYPIYLMWTDKDETNNINDTYMVGKEIHQWLGADPVASGAQYEMMNTDIDRFDDASCSAACKFKFDNAIHSYRFSIVDFKDIHWGNGRMGGFWFLVDKNNAIADQLTTTNAEALTKINDIDALINGTSIYKVNNDPIAGTNSVIPMMMCVGTDWEWPKETEHIYDVYKNWSAWKNDPTARWYGLEQKDNIDRSQVVKHWDESVDED